LGAFLLAFEAIFELAPDVWIDTQGLPSSYWLISGSLKIPIMAYTHYPILQLDMFGKLKFQSYRDLTQFNMLKKSDYFGVGKLVYWSLLYYFYVYLGTKINIALANGSWTYDHLSRIWSLNSAYGHTLVILYPPCGTEYLTENVDVSKPRANKMLYLAQFRPEKRHDLLLQEFSQFLKKNYAGVAKPTDEIPTIVYAGSCRTADDTATLKSLQQQVEDLELSEFVTFRVDISYAEVVELLSTCKFGLNAMWNEHFGIGVVEYMARGCIPIVHASAGPLFDIVGGDELENWNTDTGFFFKSYDDPDLDKSIQAKVPSGFVAFDINGRTINYPTFETLLTEIFVIDRSFIADSRLIKVRQNDQQLVKQKFSNKTFNQHWMQYINELDALEKTFREERRSKVEKVF
jgi:alpha-1,2-mannosyltransferase